MEVGSLKNAGVSNSDGLCRFAGATAKLFEAVDDIFAFEHFTKNDVSAIQPGGLLESDEELRAIGVWTRVRHGEQIWLCVLKVEVLVSELIAVDRLTTSSVSGREVTSLSHEGGNNSVE